MAKSGVKITLRTVPVPSPIHYELLLQLLERQTLSAIPAKEFAARAQVQTIIIMLRKAMVLQKQFEENCAHQRISTTYRWSLNELSYLPGLPERLIQ